MRPLIHPGPPATKTVRLLDGPAKACRTTSRRDTIWVASRLRRGVLPVPVLRDGLVVVAPLNRRAADVREEWPEITWLCYQRADIQPPWPTGWGAEPPAHAISYRWVRRLETGLSIQVAATRVRSSWV